MKAVGQQLTMELTSSQHNLECLQKDHAELEGGLVWRGVEVLFFVRNPYRTVLCACQYSPSRKTYSPWSRV